jgi:hypothetical protein
VYAQGAFWYNVYPGRSNAALFVHFLRDFMRRLRKAMYWVPDRLPAH